MRVSDGVPLLEQITCPNCWEKFPPEAALAISGHPDLVGDPRLADETEQRRFTPTRFTVEGAAIDERDERCLELACPHCHLLVPRVLLERRETLFLSIFGRASSGKSVFLAALARQMEMTLPQRFGLGVTEPHPASNTVIRDYKSRLFHEVNPDALVTVPKNEPTGHRHYQTVLHGPGDERMYPRPMLFQIAPIGAHPNARMPQRHTRTICLYDHAGEHFGPGFASPRRPTTHHLARSSALLFVFDPTSEPAFVERCRGDKRDPQFGIARSLKENQSQSVILETADANRKTLLGREIAEPLDTPLVVILSKFDAWKHVVAGDLPAFSRGPRDGLPVEGFVPAAVEAISGKMRELLMLWCPGIVSAAERCSRRVCYIPVSASGTSPIVAGQDLGSDPPRPVLKFRRGDIKPVWAEVPLLWILENVTTGLVPVAGRPVPQPASPPPPDPAPPHRSFHEKPPASRPATATDFETRSDPRASWSDSEAVDADWDDHDRPDPATADHPADRDDKAAFVPSADAPPPDWTVREILNDAWNLSDGFKGTFWLATLLLIAVVGAIQWGFFRASPWLEDRVCPLAINLFRDGLDPQTEAVYKRSLFIAVKSLFFLMTGVFVTWPLIAGGMMLAVQRACDQSTSVLDIGRWMRRWAGIAGLNILFYLSSAAWFACWIVAQELRLVTAAGAVGLETATRVCMGLSAVLFFVPGLYLMVGYSIATPLLLERNLSPWEALATSRRLIHPCWWRVLLLWVAILGICVLAAFGLGIGFIWIGPTAMLAFAVLYRKLLGEPVAGCQGE